MEPAIEAAPNDAMAFVILACSTARVVRLSIPVVTAVIPVIKILITFAMGTSLNFLICREAILEEKTDVDHDEER